MLDVPDGAVAGFVDLVHFAVDLRFGWMGMRGMIRRSAGAVISVARSDETPRHLPNQSEASASVKPDASRRSLRLPSARVPKADGRKRKAPAGACLTARSADICGQPPAARSQGPTIGKQWNQKWSPTIINWFQSHHHATRYLVAD